MDRLPNLIGAGWDFAAQHPFVAAWLAVTSVWMMFSLARRDGA